MDVKVLVEPDTPILSLDKMKEHLTVEHDEDNELIKDFIYSACEYVSSKARASFQNRTLECTIYEPDAKVRLPYGPVIQMQAVKVLDAAGNEFAAKAIQQGDVVVNLTPGVMSMTITYTAGMDKVPHTVIQAIKMLVAHWYENREATVDYSLQQTPFAVEALLANHQRGFFQ